jgi:hypothetical protein
MTRHARFSILRATAAAAVLALAACESAPPAPPPPPPAPVAPPISLAPRVIELASAYQAYVRDASNIAPTFASGPDVHASLRKATSYQPEQLAAGQVAYAAIVALQDPTFVADVRSYAADPIMRAKVRDSILRDPAYVVGFKGSDAAAGLVVAALNGEGSRVRSVGESVRKAAYDVQHQKWSKERIPTPELRLAEAKTLSATPITPAAHDLTRLNAAALRQQALPVTGAALAPPYTPVVIRGMAIAALAALGEGGEANSRYVEALTVDPNNGKCLDMSKLNLYQCLAVAKPWYEDVFCLGQHVLIDTGQCIVKASGDLPPPPVVIPAAAPAGASPLQTPVQPIAQPATAASAANTPTATSADAAASPAAAVSR